MTVTHLAIVGPTASGKSALALELARALGDVELVSVDSMQVYRGLDIGTAKPTLADRVAVPHHLIDVADADVAAFEIGFKVDDVDRAYTELIGAGATPAVPPTDRPWGQRTAYVRDPDGHLVELAQSLVP